MKNEIFKILKILLPSNVLNFLSFFYGMFIKQYSYTLDGEDIFIVKYFKYLKVSKGTYLDIGAFHPLWLSKTHLLHKMGWSGYAVDVSDEKLKWFRFLRGARCKTIEAIISEKKNKTLNLYSFNNNVLISELDTDSLSLAKVHSKRNKKTYKKKTIKNIYIRDLIESVGKVDFLKLSVNISPEILYHIDFSKYAPQVINFRINKRKIADKPFNLDKKLHNFLTSKNYVKYFMSMSTVCYVKSRS
jgi:hypothetical protein